MCSAAANAAGIPSVLITNFTFDSVYSYLSTQLLDSQDASVHPIDSLHTAIEPKLEPDIPIPREEVEPLVRKLWDGYRCADLLLRLPGAIPIPSFAQHPALPSSDWVDVETRTFVEQIFDHLLQTPSKYTLLPQIPFPPEYPPKTAHRTVISAPLLVRSPDPAVYSEPGRKRLLSSIGVPEHQQNAGSTKILIVSFGGQIFHKPPSHSRSHSRSASQSATPNPTILQPSKAANVNGIHQAPQLSAKDVLDMKRIMPPEAENAGAGVEALTNVLQSSIQTPRRSGSLRIKPTRSHSQSLLLVPGAPAASVPSSPMVPTVPAFPTVIPPTPKPDQSLDDPFAHADDTEFQDDVFGTLLPDASWIAIVCGVPKDWAAEDGEELPENFYVAPKDVYMPDLTAVADVLLGKLVRNSMVSVKHGYSQQPLANRDTARCQSVSTRVRRLYMVSEPSVATDGCSAADAVPPVPRPLFIEEHGLRLLLEKEGVGVELSRTSYESGEWAEAVEQAYSKGKEAKARKRREGETGKRASEGKMMAETLVDWVKCWKDPMAAAAADGSMV